MLDTVATRLFLKNNPDARFSRLYFCHSLNRLQRGLSAIAELVNMASPQLGKEYFTVMKFVRFSPPIYSYSIQSGSGLSLRGESLGSFEIPRESSLGYCNRDVMLILLRG